MVTEINWICTLPFLKKKIGLKKKIIPIKNHHCRELGGQNTEETGRQQTYQQQPSSSGWTLAPHTPTKPRWHRPGHEKHEGHSRRRSHQDIPPEALNGSKLKRRWNDNLQNNIWEQEQVPAHRVLGHLVKPAKKRKEGDLVQWLKSTEHPVHHWSVCQGQPLSIWHLDSFHLESDASIWDPLEMPHHHHTCMRGRHDGKLTSPKPL